MNITRIIYRRTEFKFLVNHITSLTFNEVIFNPISQLIDHIFKLKFSLIAVLFCLFFFPLIGKSQYQVYQLSSKSESIIYRLSLEVGSTIKAQILDSLENNAFVERFDSLKNVLSSIVNDDRLELQVMSELARESKLLDRGNDTYKYSVRMLYLAEKLADSTFIAYACYEIGNNIRLGVVSKRPYEAYFKRASVILETLPDPLSQSTLKYIRILLTDDRSVGLRLAKEAIDLLQNNLDESDKSMMESLARHLNVAGLYAEENQSLDYYEEGLKVAQRGENHLMQAFILNNMGYGFQMSGRYHQAIPYYLEALDVSLSVGLKNLASNSLNNLTTCYRELKKFEEALMYQNALFSMTFSVMNDNYYESLAREKVTHEVDRVELRNDLLLAEQKLQARQRWILIITSILLLVITGFIFWSGKKVKIANQKLKALDKVKARFFANISHELRTPITLINGPIESMIAGAYGEVTPVLADQLIVVRNNGKNLINLVNEILDLTKLEAGKLKLNENPVHLYGFLNELLAAYQTEIEARKIDFQFDFQFDQNGSVLIDEVRFGKIINNLLSNAFKFTPDEGEIIFSVVEENGNIRFSVKDNGKGIHLDDIEHVFERFYQSEQSDTKARGGTGIGLALSQELAKLHYGSITVNSELGKGSEFILSFPLKETISRPVELEEEFNVGLIKTSLDAVISTYTNTFEIERPVLLLTEDHTEMRAFIASIIRPFFDVLEAENGMEALEILKDHEVDMIISDVMMPKMDGFELLEKIKGDEKLMNISMIMLTARAAEEDKLFALTLGVDDYLTKPFSREELLVRTRNILDNRIVRKLANAESSPDADELVYTNAAFVDSLKEIIEKHLADSLLTVSFLASEMSMSERQLLRKLKLINGLTPVQFIKEVRLQKAKRLLENGQIDSVSNTAYKVGFDKVSYFSSQYINRFGKKPSDVLQINGGENV
jgi:signal transduction histidine kinase/DNA-binding response OmpR family regulator